MKIKYLLLRFLTFLILPISCFVGSKLAFVVALFAWLAVICPAMDLYFINKLDAKGVVKAERYTFPYAAFFKFMLLEYKD